MVPFSRRGSRNPLRSRKVSDCSERRRVGQAGLARSVESHLVKVGAADITVANKERMQWGR